MHQTIIMDQALIERIVTDVLSQLQPEASVRSVAAQVTTTAATEVQLDQAIITSEVLQDRIQNGQILRIGAKSILTPTARDWLKERKIRWQRAGRAAHGSSTVILPRRLLIGTVTPAVHSVRDAVARELPGWKHELLGQPAELAETAARAIASAETDLVVAIGAAADVVACRANRNERVRAAVVTSVEHVRLLVEHLGPNVFVVNPVGRSYMELRGMLRTCAALPTPRVPQSWK